MKLFQQFLTGLFLFSLLSFSNVQANEAIKINPAQCFECKYKPILSETSQFVNKHKGDKLLEDGNFNILDSLANAYSYFTGDQQPLVYDTQTGTLITIKRGFYDTRSSKYSSYEGENLCDNLFILKSTDWGNTWSEPLLVYNVKTSGNTDKWARYPSVAPIIIEDNLWYAFTFPITGSSSGWNGFVNGIYYYDQFTYALDTAHFEGKVLGWLGTASKIVANGEGDATGIALGNLIIQSGSPLQENNYIGMRKTIGFDEWFSHIPSQWHSNKFISATGSGDSARTSSLISLIKDDDNKLFMAAYGVFTGGDTDDRRSVGVSTSEDFGETWTEFNILPFTLVREYAQAQGANPDSVAFVYNQDFVVLNNGDYSFAMYLREYNDSRETDSLNIKQIVEVYWENGVWGVRKVADLTGLWVPYFEEGDQTQASLANNQLQNEIQISRTVDGNNVVIKWIDLLGVVHNWDEGTFTWETSDIYCSTRNIASSTWSESQNLTNSNAVDRITWIPDMLPDNLNIPILKVKTMAIEGETENDARIRQMNTAGDNYEQHVLIGHYNLVLSVDEYNSSSTNEVNINGVYPNPASDKANIDFTLSASGNVTIDIYNVYGKLVANVFNSFINDGFNSVNFNTKDLPTGVYFITLRTANESITKQLNVIR